MEKSQEGPLSIGQAFELDQALRGGIISSRIDSQQAQRWIGQSGQAQAAVAAMLKLEPSEAFRRLQNLNWLDELVAEEKYAHQAFFGQTFDLTQFAATLERFGEDRVRQWAKLGLEVHFLPKVTFAPAINFPGWKVKPEGWFWQQVAAGSIKRRNAAGGLEVVKEIGCDGVTLLIDTRCKPNFNASKQMFANDEHFLGGIIKDLRAQGKISRYDLGPQSSRFGISSRDWDEHLRPALQARPEFDGVTFRLEQAIEANAIPQIYKRMPRRKDGQTTTWVWYEEFFGIASDRLCGGGSGGGGLAYVDCSHVVSHWINRGVRPVGVLDT